MERFGYRRKALGAATHKEKLGCSLYKIPPGTQAWPYHYHLADEEASYVLYGSGTLRNGEREFTAPRANHVALPPGGSGAQQITKTSD